MTGPQLSTLPDHQVLTLTLAGGLPAAAPGHPPDRRQMAVRTGGSRAAARAAAAARKAAASVGLVGAAPVLALGALAVRLSGPGPILVRHTVLDDRGVPVEVVAFRTTAGREVTRVGRLLRLTGVDRLPHLLHLAALLPAS